MKIKLNKKISKLVKKAAKLNGISEKMFVDGILEHTFINDFVLERGVSEGSLKSLIIPDPLTKGQNIILPPYLSLLSREKSNLFEDEIDLEREEGDENER